MGMSLSRLWEMVRDRKSACCGPRGAEGLDTTCRLNKTKRHPQDDRSGLGSGSGGSRPLKSRCAVSRPDEDGTLGSHRRRGWGGVGATMGSGPRAAMGAGLFVCVSTPMHMHRQKRPRVLLDSCCTETIPGNESLMFPVSGPTSSVTC